MIIFGVGAGGQIKVGSRAPEEWSKFDAFLVPAGFSCESAGEHRSVVFVSLSSTRLQSTIQTMLGIDLYRARDSRIFEPGKLDIKTNVASFEAAFRNIFSMADIFSESQVMLNASGLDDIFYRTLAIALNLETFTVNSERRLSKPSHRQLDRVCQYIMANLTRNITLTELERAGHLSRRTLHNAFYLTFQMSPMQWVREQRLLKAHRMLSKPDSDLKVTEVLYACGFANASLFSAQYLKRFGELPSMTMKRQQKTIWNLSAKFL
jgi:AraC-like DNA-binding protein